MHLLWAVVTVAFAFPFIPIHWRRALKARWSRQLLEVLGVRAQFAGRPPAGGLVVANHISWLDIYAINAFAPSVFVSKDDLLTWPLIGWLSRQTETIFLQRGSRTAAMNIQTELVGKLCQGCCIGAFPEGTTSSGHSVLHFYSAVFQSVIDAGVKVMPVAIHYMDSDRKASVAPVYAGETSLWQSLLAVASADSLTAYLDFLPALEPAGMNRRQLAESAHALIAGRLARKIAGDRAHYDVPMAGSLSYVRDH